MLYWHNLHKHLARECSRTLPCSSQADGITKSSARIGGCDITDTKGEADRSGTKEGLRKGEEESIKSIGGREKEKTKVGVNYIVGSVGVPVVR